MKRVEALRILSRLDALVVCNLGTPSRELYDVADKPSNFYMLGSMGLASSIGLGMAIAQRHRVIAVDGDGSLLMNLGSLSTIAHFGPRHFVLVVLDNRAYGSTGGQASHTALGTDLTRAAKACGMPSVSAVATASGLRRALAAGSVGPKVIVARVESGGADVPPVPIAPRKIRTRFMAVARVSVHTRRSS